MWSNWTLKFKMQTSQWYEFFYTVNFSFFTSWWSVICLQNISTPESDFYGPTSLEISEALNALGAVAHIHQNYLNIAHVCERN